MHDDGSARVNGYRGGEVTSGRLMRESESLSERTDGGGRSAYDLGATMAPKKTQRAVSGAKRAWIGCQECGGWLYAAGHPAMRGGQRPKAVAIGTALAKVHCKERLFFLRRIDGASPARAHTYLTRGPQDYCIM